MVGWLANYFVSERTPEATRDAYLYAVAIPTLFLAFGLNHAWAFLWAYEHGECWLFFETIILGILQFTEFNSIRTAH